MNIEKTNPSKKRLVVISIATLTVLLLLIAVPLFVFRYVDAIFCDPKIVVSMSSPDGRYEAYVEESPSIKTPKQSLFFEHSDKNYFMHIADLSEGVDSIKEVVWSPDSEIVIFHSHYYLTATHVKKLRTIRIYLGNEWKRALPQRHNTTFDSGGLRQSIETIKFSERGGFSYKLKGVNNFQTVSI